LLVFKKYKKFKKNQIYKKKEKKIEGPIFRSMQHFTYKYWSTTQTKRGAILQNREKPQKNPKPQKP
jgi:phosphatidylinositol kinase/protein kinase (PI-3  family)